MRMGGAGLSATGGMPRSDLPMRAGRDGWSSRKEEKYLCYVPWHAEQGDCVAVLPGLLVSDPVADRRSHHWTRRGEDVQVCQHAV